MPTADSAGRWLAPAQYVWRVGTAIGNLLAEAVGVAISPVPIIALILMLFSRAPRRNSVSFLLGWLAGLMIAGLVVLAIEPPGSDSTSTTTGYVKTAVGVLFLLLGIRQWRGRPEAGTEPSPPAWMNAIDGFSAAKALGLGLLLTLANPKNLGLTIAAAASIASGGLSAGEAVVTLAVFVLIASLTIIVPVAAYLFAGDRAAPALTSVKQWMIQNNATIMTVLLVVLGAKVLGDGVAMIA